VVYDGNNALQQRYLQAEGMDQTLAEERIDATQPVVWLLADHEGSIRDAVTLSSGGGSVTAQWHATYSSFGQLTVVPANTLTAPRFTYTGREWDANAQLYYYRARWYDPATARFISEDPLQSNSGDNNFYRYVHNGPEDGTDPTGHGWFSKVVHSYAGVVMMAD
jgi:RHS repeat-associated protein